MKTHFVLSIFRRKFCLSWDTVEIYGRARQATENNIMLSRSDASCMPGNYGKNTDTLAISNAYCNKQQRLQQIASMLRFTYTSSLVVPKNVSAILA